MRMAKERQYVWISEEHPVPGGSAFSISAGSEAYQMRARQYDLSLGLTSKKQSEQSTCLGAQLGAYTLPLEW
jgi:hypothetical protein